MAAKLKAPAGALGAGEAAVTAVAAAATGADAKPVTAAEQRRRVAAASAVRLRYQDVSLDLPPDPETGEAVVYRVHTLTGAEYVLAQGRGFDTVTDPVTGEEGQRQNDTYVPLLIALGAKHPETGERFYSAEPADVAEVAGLPRELYVPLAVAALTVNGLTRASADAAGNGSGEAAGADSSSPSSAS